MNQERIGKFITKLRKEKGLTQEELASKIPISRQAVSRWECGKTIPDSQTLLILSEIFNVTVNELLYGERKSKINVEQIENITLDLLNSNNNKKNIIKWLLIIIVGAVIIFLMYYFLSLYNSIKIFRISYHDEKIRISDGLFVLTREKNYFQLGKVECLKGQEITKLNLYYEIGNDKVLVCETYDDTITLNDYLGYNEFFNYDNLNEIINNLYLDIYYSDNTTLNTKLSVIEDYRNNKLVFFKSQKKALDEKQDNNYWQENLEKNTTVIEKIKKTFSSCTGGYFFDKELESRRIGAIYAEDSYVLSLNIYEKNQLVDEWYYNFELNQLLYNNYINSKLNYSISNYLEKNKCDFGICKDYSKINEYYKIMEQILEGN